MTAQPEVTYRHKRIHALLTNNAYLIVVLVLTIFSLLIMLVQMILKPGNEVYDLVNTYNNVVCYFFLFDFALHMIDEPRKRDYFIGQRGYFDLLGSIPSFGFSQYTVLLRLFRLFRLTRLRKFMNPKNRELLATEILENRGKYAVYITVLAAMIVLMTASVMALWFEGHNPDANITTGGDSLWWSIVTITTVGYGDKYPTTPGGRLTGVAVMFTGVGIIGALASILASVLVPQPKPASTDAPKPVEGEQAGEPKADDPKTKLLELQALIAAQEKSTAELKDKLSEIQKLL